MRPRLAAASVGIAALLLVPAAVAGSSGFQQRLAGALRAPQVSPAQTGAVVLDLRTGQTVFAHNADLALRPASNEKLATTYAALTALGPSFRIETDVLGDGRQSGATWLGDLVLKGYGDPALTRVKLVSLAHQVAATGIRHVSGRIVGDESWFDARRTGAGWKAQLLPPRVACAVGAHRQPRLDRTLRDDASGIDRGAALPPRPAPRGCHGTRGRRGRSCVCRRVQLANVESPPFGSRTSYGRLQRQLLRGDAAEGDRCRAGRPWSRGSRRRGNAAPARRAREFRSPACGWWTVPASRSSTAGRLVL